jgi:hypothetical protein
MAIDPIKRSGRGMKTVEKDELPDELNGQSQQVMETDHYRE